MASVVLNEKFVGMFYQVSMSGKSSTSCVKSQYQGLNWPLPFSTHGLCIDKLLLTASSYSDSRY